MVTGDVSNPTRGVGKGWQQGGTNAEGHTKVFGPITVRAFKGTSATSQAVRADGDKVTLRLEENALAALRGRVIAADGTPMPYAEIELLPADAEVNRYFVTTRANENGVYAIDNLWPDLTIQVRAKGKGSLPTQTGTVKLQRGQITEVPEIRMEKANSFVAGRVINLKNQPVAGAQVECNGNDTGRQTMTNRRRWSFSF